MIKSSNHRISLTVSKSDFDTFQTLYRNCLSRFVQQALKKACSDRDFFSDVFFYIDSEKDNCYYENNEV